MKNLTLKGDEGFSLIELLIVVAIIGIIATIAVPQLMDAIDRGRQRATMADMRNIATANGTYRVDEGEYAGALADMEPDYMQVVPTEDAWNTAFAYNGGANTYLLESWGSDTADSGAPAENPWPQNGEYEADLQLRDGQFVCAPGLDTGSCE